MLAFAMPAYAAGGADVIDDAFPESVDVCHVESWLVEGFHNGAVQHLGMGCTPKAAPRLEIDGAVERQRGAGATAWSFSPSVKTMLFSHPASISMAISSFALLDQHGHMTGASVYLPLSIAHGKYTTLNLNAGWEFDHAPGDAAHKRASWGAQLEQAILPHFTLIGEVFGASGQAPGEQGGIRWSPGPERVDIDLRGSHGPNHAGNAMTIGLTARI